MVTLNLFRATRFLILLLALALVLPACQAAENAAEPTTESEPTATLPSAQITTVPTAAATATAPPTVTASPTTTPTETSQPAAPAATATTPATDRGGVTLVGPVWQLTSMGPVGNEEPAVPGSDVTLQFQADGTAGGSSGCNRYSGPYEIGGGAITFGHLYVSLRPCPVGPITDQEQAYLDAIRDTGAYELSAAGLTIWYAKGQSALHFVATNP